MSIIESICSDDAPAMLDINSGFISYMKREYRKLQ